MSGERNEFESGSFGNNNYAYQSVNFGRPKKMGWSVVSLVTGILSVICCCLSIAPIVFGVVAIVSSILSRKTLGYFDGMSIAGLVLGIFGVVFGVAVIIAVNALGEEFWNQYLEEIEKQFGETNPDGTPM